MSDVKVIFGSTTGCTEAAANIIAANFGTTAINVANAAPADFQADLLILGTSTWGVGDLQDDWFAGVQMLDGIDLKGKKAAVFAMGDQPTPTSIPCAPSPTNLKNAEQRSSAKPPPQATRIQRQRRIRTVSSAGSHSTTRTSRTRPPTASQSGAISSAQK